MSCLKMSANKGFSTVRTGTERCDHMWHEDLRTKRILDANMDCLITVTGSKAAIAGETKRQSVYFSSNGEELSPHKEDNIVN